MEVQAASSHASFNLCPAYHPSVLNHTTGNQQHTVGVAVNFKVKL